jgi:dTDP-4-dehydrorhamnose reductase
VNLAGESRTDEVERDPNAYRYINAQAPAQLVVWCDRNEAHLIHVSTQAVFDGTAPPYGPDSETNPINAYGRQKKEAECHVRKYANWTIVRPTFVLGTRPLGIGRVNPLETMLTATEQQQVDDRHFSPLFASDAAESIWKLVESRPKRTTVHLGIPQRVSRYDIAMLAAPSGATVKPVQHDSFAGIAPRPKDTTYTDGAWHCRNLVQGIEEARREMESKKAMDIQDRAREIALFLGIPEDQALAKLRRGFLELHAEVAEDFRRYNPQSDAGLLNWYRTTEAYIWELTAYHLDEGYNYMGMCGGIAEHLCNAGARQVLCLGDGIGDVTLALRRAGMDSVYHDLRGSRTAEFAAFRWIRHMPDFMPEDMTDAWQPNDRTRYYDAAISLDFLEHITDVELWARATVAALKPGGLFCAQNAFGCGSGADGPIPMHLACNDKYVTEWDPLMRSLGMELQSPNWYRKVA